MRKLGYLASVVLVLGLWLPWGKISVGLFGSDMGTLGSVNGQEIGSGVLGLPVGWIAAAAGLGGAIGLAVRGRGLVIVSGTAALLVTGYALLAIPGRETASSNGQDVSGIISAQVDYAWGLFAVAAASVVLLLAGLRQTRRPGGEPNAAALPIHPASVDGSGRDDEAPDAAELDRRRDLP